MLDIPANDHGALYIVEHFGPPLTGSKAGMIGKIIGQVDLNLDFVDLIPPAGKAEMALPDLIQQGYEMPLTPAQVTTLRRVTGPVVLIMSRAFGSKAQQITLPEDSRAVMVLRDAAQIQTSEKLTSDGAAGEMNGPQTAKPRKSDARMSGMVATAALLVMFALVALMVWVGQ
ncbi:MULTISPECIES: hypothetical protein [unclassified Yoonia]|uniref:hypothetical protein n=1 Tax=unclassified Yoonia TaxID=2629118 RepID=UPI002AFE8A91|nr:MULTISPECIES: hypothetical protein [unclassified Yoonia]